MDEETIVKYLYTFENPIYAKRDNLSNDAPKENKTYFFVQTDGAIYICTVIGRKGAYYYTINIEKNINNKLKVKEGKETKVLIKYTNPGENMLLWEEIPNYNSIKEEINNKLKVKKGNTIGINIDQTNPEKKIARLVEISNNDSIDNLVDELSTLTVNNKRKIDDYLIKKALKEDEEDEEEDNNSRSLQTNNNSSRGPVVNVNRIYNRTTGSRFGGKGRKKTKRNKNKKRKTHRKR